MKTIQTTSQEASRYTVNIEPQQYIVVLTRPIVDSQKMQFLPMVIGFKEPTFMALTQDGIEPRWLDTFAEADSVARSYQHGIELDESKLETELEWSFDTGHWVHV